MSSSLAARLRELEHDLDAARVSQIETFVSLVQSYGTRFNLVGNLDRLFVERDLVCSSLEVLRLSALSGSVIDVGSGAGFPGIPLAIAVPDASFVLVEKRKKRAAFLEMVVRQLSLANVSVRHDDIDRLVGETFDWAVARAFAPPHDWLELARRLIGGDGRVCLFTNREAWAELDLTGWSVLGKCPDRSRAGRLVANLGKASGRS